MDDTTYAIRLGSRWVAVTVSPVRDVCLAFTSDEHYDQHGAHVVYVDGTDDAAIQQAARADGVRTYPTLTALRYGWPQAQRDTWLDLV